MLGRGLDWGWRGGRREGCERGGRRWWEWCGRGRRGRGRWGRGGWGRRWWRGRGRERGWRRWGGWWRRRRRGRRRLGRRRWWRRRRRGRRHWRRRHEGRRRRADQPRGVSVNLGQRDAEPRDAAPRPANHFHFMGLWQVARAGQGGPEAQSVDPGAEGFGAIDARRGAGGRHKHLLPVRHHQDDVRQQRPLLDVVRHPPAHPLLRLLRQPQQRLLVRCKQRRKLRRLCWVQARVAFLIRKRDHDCWHVLAEVEEVSYVPVSRAYGGRAAARNCRQQSTPTPPSVSHTLAPLGSCTGSTAAARTGSR